MPTPTVGAFINPDDYKGTLDAHGIRLDGHDTTLTGILAALVARLEAANVTLPGRSGSINGSLTNLIVQYGSVTGSTDGAGQITINYPLSFPNGIGVVIPCNGDVGANQFEWGLVLVNATGFVLKCSTFTGTVTTSPNVRIDRVPLTSATVRIDYIAIGW